MKVMVSLMPLFIPSSNLQPRLQEDSQLRRFWDHRGADRLDKEKQLLIDYLCTNAGGQLHYSGRDMKLSHKGMNISESDWQIFLQHAGATMRAINVPQQEQVDVSEFVASLKGDIVEVD
ncbi:group 1 truncated hemoglobin [Pseudoalteromonas sp. NBT06-2]|nr:group 1 truncated hemoglobin [Pseudoalteromonas sp. NBT06-2]